MNEKFRFENGSGVTGVKVGFGGLPPYKKQYLWFEVFDSVEMVNRDNLDKAIRDTKLFLRRLEDMKFALDDGGGVIE